MLRRFVGAQSAPPRSFAPALANARAEGGRYGRIGFGPETTKPARTRGARGSRLPAVLDRGVGLRRANARLRVLRHRSAGSVSGERAKVQGVRLTPHEPTTGFLGPRQAAQDARE